MGTAPSILIVDDEAPIRKLIASYARSEGWQVLTAVNGAEAIALVRSSDPDVVLLDVLMPELDGVEALRQIRTFSDVYVLMLTARADEADKLIGLAVGADDYLTKPFSPRELVARVKALLRRPRRTNNGASETIQIRKMEVDLARRTVRVGGVPQELTTLEFDLLTSLLEHPGQVLSRRQLLERVWGFDYYGDERVVDVHIRNLRRALGDDATDPVWIGTVRGVGYRFIDTER